MSIETDFNASHHIFKILENKQGVLYKIEDTGPFWPQLPFCPANTPPPVRNNLPRGSEVSR